MQDNPLIHKLVVRPRLFFLIIIILSFFYHKLNGNLLIIQKKIFIMELKLLYWTYISSIMCQE